MKVLLPRRRLFRMASLLAAILPGSSLAEKTPFDDERRNWWQSLAQYSRDNAQLAGMHGEPYCVFMGDSITERWRKLRPNFFTSGRICRGISGQTTPQMLVRFRADVVALKPQIVHIMAGTNDIAGNTGPATPDMIQANIATMAEIAMANGIRVIVASVLPAAHYPWKPAVLPIHPTQQVNAMLREYAIRIGATYADYYAILNDGKGGMHPGWSTGEVHPTALAYERMEVVAAAALAKAHTAPRHKLCQA